MGAAILVLGRILETAPQTAQLAAIALVMMVRIPTTARETATVETAFVNLHMVRIPTTARETATVETAIAIMTKVL